MLTQVVVGVPERDDVGSVVTQLPGDVPTQEAGAAGHHHPGTIDDEHAGEPTRGT